MSKLISRAARKNTGWNASGDNKLYGARRLRAEFQTFRRGFGQKFGLLFGSGGGGISGRLLTVAELIKDSSGTKFGRLATAILSLSLAWFLLNMKL